MAFKIGKDARIHPSARIEVKSGFIGDRVLVRDNVVIECNHLEIGHEAYFDSYAHIGGGSCHDPQAKLTIGDFLHMGRYSHINMAEPVVIGHEFGCGIGTRVFAHGAYPPATEGFPVQWGPVTIGDRVWMPHAWVNPGVTVGDNVVVSAMSLVNRDLPSGCLAGGIPARVLRENVYPRELSFNEKFQILKQIMCRTMEIINADVGGEEHTVYIGELDSAGAFGLVLDGTIFDVTSRTIEGTANRYTYLAMNQLRRNGIRFRYYADEGEYKPWGS